MSSSVSTLGREEIVRVHSSQGISPTMLAGLGADQIVRNPARLSKFQSESRMMPAQRSLLWALFFGAASLLACKGVDKEPLVESSPVIPLDPREELTSQGGIQFVAVFDPPVPAHSSSGSPLGEPAFWIGRFEVSVKDFEIFAKAMPAKARQNFRSRFTPGGDYPVVEVSWWEARAFADWLSEQDNCTYRLPSVEEWRLAARGQQTSGFPWTGPPRAGVHGNWGRVLNAPFFGAKPTLEPVGRFPAGDSWCGASDMFGNATEWCAVPEARPEPRHLEPAMGDSWKSSRLEETSEPSWLDADSTYSFVGFRLIRTSRVCKPKG